MLLGRFVTQAVELLENEDLEHEDGIERRTSSFAPIFGIVSGDFFEDWTKALPVDDVAELENTDDAAGHSFLMVQRRKKIPTTIDLAIRLHLQIFVELTRLRNLKEPGSYRRCPLEQLLEAKEWNLAGTKDVAEGVCRLGTEMAPEELATWAVALPEQTEIRNLFHREIEPGPAKRGLELATGLGKPDGLP